MSEGPEVKRIEDKISDAILGKTIVDICCKTLKDNIKQNIIGSKVKSVDTYGKNIIISFTSGVYLRNHMMMWGKWRIYNKKEFDSGKSKPPPRRIVWSNQKSSKNNENNILNNNNNNNNNTTTSSIHKTVTDVRNDSRVWLILITPTQVAVQFNGPILHFTMYVPSKHTSIAK